jgi:hypothetical protein
VHYFLVQTVEPFDVAVLHELSRLDEPDRDSLVFMPELWFFRCELWPIGSSDRLGPATVLNYAFQGADDPLGGQQDANLNG